MIKTILIPQSNELSVSIPNSYIGKEIEILIYAKDEPVNQKQTQIKTITDFIGILSESEYQNLKNHTEVARKECD